MLCCFVILVMHVLLMTGILYSNHIIYIELKNVDYASSFDDVSHGKEYSNSTACRVRDFASSMLKASDIRLHLTSPSSTYTLL